MGIQAYSIGVALVMTAIAVSQAIWIWHTQPDKDFVVTTAVLSDPGQGAGAPLQRSRMRAPGFDTVQITTFQEVQVEKDEVSPTDVKFVLDGHESGSAGEGDSICSVSIDPSGDLMRRSDSAPARRHGEATKRLAVPPPSHLDMARSASHPLSGQRLYPTHVHGVSAIAPFTKE